MLNQLVRRVQGDWALHHAAGSGDFEKVKELISHQKRVDVCDEVFVTIRFVSMENYQENQENISRLI